MKSFFLWLLPGMIFFSGPARAQKLSDQNICLNRAREIYGDIWKHYRVDKYKGLFLENFPTDTAKLNYFQGNAVKPKEVSFLWPFSSMYSATNALLHVPSVRKEYLAYLDSLTPGMEAYRDTLRYPIGYQAYPFAMEKADRYYDDNGLVGIEYTEAYLNTRNMIYLDRAKTVFKFIISGWSDQLGGGIYWLEGHKDQKPACSNGMALLVALKLYEATHDVFYLNWGKRFYNWMQTDLKAPNGLFYNNRETKNGAPNPAFYSYNTGSVLEGAVLLYQFTGDKKYLSATQHMAEATYEYLRNQPHDTHLNLAIDLPWFMTVLFRGYEALYSLNKNPKYINAIHHDLDYAWKFSRDKNGFLTNDWTAKPALINKHKWLLDEACIAELYGRLSAI